MSVSKVVESGREDGARHVLCAHIISTMGRGPVVADEDMDYPRNWRDPDGSKDTKVGHQEGGRTVCIHSLAVSPKLQGRGLGKLAMMSYLQIMNDSGTADRVALIAQEVSADGVFCL
jgi:ribosomal protein S18 acetylase RimI-like enzyme